MHLPTFFVCLLHTSLVGLTPFFPMKRVLGTPGFCPLTCDSAWIVLGALGPKGDLVLFQLPESLEDVAMYISQEEWGRQHPSKRALSRDTVQESYENVDSLGKDFFSKDEDWAISDQGPVP